MHQRPQVLAHDTERGYGDGRVCSSAPSACSPKGSSMTCIVGIADGEKVWIGGDSQGTAGLSMTVRADTKVFTNGPMVFGFTSSFRMGQLLRHKLSIPKHYEGDVDKWLCVDFIDAVRQCFKDSGYARTHDGEEPASTPIPTPTHRTPQLRYRDRVASIRDHLARHSPHGVATSTSKAAHTRRASVMAGVSKAQRNRDG